MFGLGVGELVVLSIFVAQGWMFGRIAGRLGRSPVGFGLMFMVPGVHVLALGMLAFSHARSAD
jgi:hypothetical protein